MMQLGSDILLCNGLFLLGGHVAIWISQWSFVYLTHVPTVHSV